MSHEIPVFNVPEKCGLPHGTKMRGLAAVVRRDVGL